MKAHGLQTVTDPWELRRRQILQESREISGNEFRSSFVSECRLSAELLCHRLRHLGAHLLL